MRSDGRDFARFYEAEREPMARTLLVIGGDAEAAMGSPMGWVYQVALNDLRRRLRRRAHEGRLLRRAHVEPVPPAEVDPELWAAVGALPLRQREAIVLRYVGDLTEREVATVLGVSEGAASHALASARRRLADDLNDREEAPSS